MKGRYSAVALIAMLGVPDLGFAQTATPAPASHGKSAVEVIVHAQARRRPVDVPPSLNLYAALPHIRDIALSPSGDQVAFLTEARGMNLLVAYRIADKHQSFVKLKAGNVSSLAWADDSHVLLVDSQAGLRGTCVGGVQKSDSQTTSDAVQSTLQSQPQLNTPGGAMGQGAADTAAARSAVELDMDSNKPPPCAFFGVHEEDGVTLVDLNQATGRSLGVPMGDAPNMPLGVPQRVTIDGKAQLMGAFMEMRDSNVGDQPAQRVYLWRVDPANGHGEMIDDGGGDVDRESRYVDDWLFDKTGHLKARAVYEFDKEQFRIEMKVGSQWRPVLTRTLMPDDKTFAPYLVGLASDGQAIIILDSDTHGNDPKGAARHFHYYTLSSDGAFSAPLDKGDASQNKPVFDPMTGRLAGFSQSAEETTYTLTDPELAHLYDLAKNAAATGSVKVSSVADDPHKMVVHVDGRENTGMYYFVDFATGASATLGEDYPNVPSEWIASQEEFSYRAADGTEIPALLTLPPKPEAHNLPLIVLPHDGPEGHDEAGFNWLAQALASRGYLVLQPNYRGSDGHGMDFMIAGYGQWNGKMLTDMSDGVQDLVHQGLADPSRVCYVGIGYGGYAALRAASQADTRCAVAINGISDVSSYVSWKNAHAALPDTDDFAALIPDPHTPRGFGPDANSRQTLAGYVGRASNDTVAAASVRAPVMLIHSADDGVVPISQSHRLRDDLKAAGRPATYVELPDGGHDVDSQTARLQLLQAVTDFLAKQSPAQN